MKASIEHIPRTVALVRAGEDQRSTLSPQAQKALSAYVETNWIPDGVPIFVMVDQTKLPSEEDYLCTSDWRVVMDAIKNLVVRGAPAIGIAGAAAVALRASEFCYAKEDKNRSEAIDFERVFVIDESDFDPDLYLIGMEYAANMVVRSRPTAVNLAWAVDRAIAVVQEELSSGSDVRVISDVLYEFVEQLIVDDENTNRQIGMYGAELLGMGSRVLTHCNAGSLATAFFGTALGVIYTAFDQGKIERVFADETRPVNQGARLTAWELARAHVPVTLICDDMAASLMASGKIDAVVVGADRIAANGDTANKIGTLGLAVLADHYSVPFYVAAPVSTIDFSLECGEQIPIEERDHDEVLSDPIEGVEVWNPAFDITPAALITSIITESGVFEPNDLLRSA